MTFADEQIVYRDLGPDGDWGTLRFLVDGHDVTMFRDTPAQIGGYQLQEPYGYGPADFSFPQITSFEVDAWGTGDLWWFDIDKRAELVQVDADGNRVRTVWEGFITVPNPTNDGTNIHCDGDASGRLALRDKHPEIFTWIKDAGLLLADAFRKCNLSTTPHLGTVTGIELDERRLSSSGKMLGYCDEILAQTMTAAGDQLTVMPDGSGNYVQQWKDRTTVAASIFNGAAGVEIDLSRDLSEEPTTLYASGRRADGGLWLNAKAPGLKQGEPAPFPGTLALGDAGDDVQTLQAKLVGMGYLDREDALGTDFDDETEDAVIDLQDDAGLPETGVVDEATWNALFDLGDTGLSLRQAYQAPLVELSETRKWNRTSNGSKAGINPNYNAARTPVDRTYEGFGEKKRARRYLKRELNRIHDGKNWVGTIVLKADVIRGDHSHVDNAPEGVLSRLDLVAGMNVKLRHFDGATKFHVSGINVDSDLTVRLAVDTKARDLLTLGQILERNAASRVSPARQWLREHRGRGPNQEIVEFLAEIGGKIWQTVSLEPGWNIVPVVAGQSGSINRIGLEVTGPKVEYVVAATALKTSPAWWESRVGNPFDNDTNVQSLTLDDGGSGYTSAPKVTITGGGGRGAKAVATISGGVVTDVRLTQRGRGYESAPSVSLSGGGGSGASVSANLGATGAGRWTDGITQEITNRIILGAWGDNEQPCGYGPDGEKVSSETGEPTGDPITGVFLDDGGFPYRTFDEPFIYVAVYVKQACKLKPQRVLWPVYEAGM